MNKQLESFIKSADHSNSNHKILTTTTAFGILRKGIIRNLGERRAKGFLLRYGWSLGASDAEEAKKKDNSIEYLIKQASILHLSTGHIKDINQNNIEMNDSENIIKIIGKGKWIDSFETTEHLKHHGISIHLSAITLTGYASGYM